MRHGPSPFLDRAPAGASLPAAALPPAGDLDSGWLELGASELRLRRDGGDVLWSAALPDIALAGYELAAADLASLDDDEDLEEVSLERT